MYSSRARYVYKTMFNNVEDIKFNPWRLHELVRSGCKFGGSSRVKMDSWESLDNGEMKLMKLFIII